MRFKKLEIKEWQQFEKIDISFHDQLTILTGANGSGKSTIIEKILAKHCGWQSQSCATPKKVKGSGVLSYFSRLWNGEAKDEKVIGDLLYNSNLRVALTVPINQDFPEYQIELSGAQLVKCLFIPSNRPIFRYQSLSSIPVSKKSKQSASDEASNVTRSRYHGHNSQSSSFFMKNTLIGWAIQGYGNKVIDNDDEQISYYEGFQDVLKKVLPRSLRFESLEIRNMDVIFVCNDKKDEFMFEQASGGISALIDLAWQIYVYSTKDNMILPRLCRHSHATILN
ncbi:MAG: AAA family ATPase [Gammaproteobacteria bacterium]